MRIYLPLAASELNNQQLYSQFAWTGNQEFCRLWGIDPLDEEQAEDIAMTMAAMSCLETVGDSYPGRIVAALDVDSGEINASSNPGIFAVKKGFDWQRLVSLHVDGSEELALCQQVRQAVIPKMAAAWCRGNFSGGEDQETPGWELWQQLAAEPLSWYDQSELDYLRRSLAENPAS